MTEELTAEPWCEEVDASGLIPPCVSPKAVPDQPPVVALAGAYSTGKTSVIKRVLFERGLPIPDHLAVAPDPTTFTSQQVAAGSIVLKDTPGLGSGKELHNERAVDAAVDSDVLVLLLTPQLLSASDEDAWSLLSGAAWGAPENRPIGDWIRLVINRFDNAGADPERERVAYLALATRKRQELLRSIHARQSSSVLKDCLVIASDPFGYVGDDAPGPQAYEEGAGWDGISELLVWLDGVPGEMDTLRPRRAVRVRARLLARAATQRTAALPQLQAVASVGSLRAHALEAHQREFGRTWGKAEADLTEALKTAVGLGSVAASSPDRAELVKKRVQHALNDWGGSLADRLSLLAQSSPESVGLAGPTSAAETRLEDVMPEDGALNPFLDALALLRKNSEQLKVTTEACRSLAQAVPRLKGLGQALRPEVLAAAASVADLFWQLSRVEEKRARVAAETQRSQFLKVAQSAAQEIVAPLREWSRSYEGALKTLAAEVKDEVKDSRATLQAAEIELTKIKGWLETAPC